MPEQTDPHALQERPTSVVRRAVLVFTAWSLVALVVVGAGTMLVSGWIAREQALRDAHTRGTAIATTIAAPLVNASVRSREPGADARLTEVLTNRMQDGSVSHIKLWSEDGALIWADDKSLVGRQFPLGDAVTSLFGTTNVTAEVSELEKAENVRERGEGELLEVYVGAFDSDGSPMVFEAYLSTERMREVERGILMGVLPLALGGLVLFQLAILPAAVALARRVEASQAERSRTMRHALETSELERRRIAQDLHDGVIPDLAGVGYVLPAVESQLAGAGVDSTTRATVHRLGELLKSDVTALRTLLTDIYPPDLQGPGLRIALSDLADSARRDGIEVAVDISPDLDLPTDAARLAYRVAREGLRNVVKHARATTATMHVRREADRVVVRVVDSGAGLAEDAEAPRGHFGLQLLSDTLEDFGGRLSLDPGADGGAVLTATFPVLLVTD